MPNNLIERSIVGGGIVAVMSTLGAMLFGAAGFSLGSLSAVIIAACEEIGYSSLAWILKFVPMRSISLLTSMVAAGYISEFMFTQLTTRIRGEEPPLFAQHHQHLH